MSPPAHRTPIRVYYEDTDAGGIVYYANYLKFAERARSEMLRELGFDNPGLMAQKGVALAVRRVAVDYLRPARLDDLLTVETRVLDVKGASLDLAQAMTRDGDTLVDMTLKLACISLVGRPARFPGPMREALAASGFGAAD
ncbi:MAG: tol-pal system-associated acyl-CoA thioesterase [Rhodospirillaceae bacterium]